MKKPSIKPAFHVDLEDAELFRAAIGEINPIPRQDRVAPQKPSRRPLLRPSVPVQAIPDTLSDFATGDIPEEFLRNGLSRMTLRKLRRGTWPAQDNLDLHGNTIDAARKLLQAFLHKAIQRKLHCVLVIHGKGLNSKGGEAVLRKLTRHWLTQHTDVLGFCNAPQGSGGSGAALVLLKSSP